MIGLVAACGSHREQAPRPASFARGQEIPLGELTLQVTGWEVVPERHPPLSTLKAAPGEKAIVAFVEWRGLASRSEMEQSTFLERYLESGLRVRDSDGFEVRALHAMPKVWYAGDFGPREHAVAREWAVVFHVWVDSKGYTLLIEPPSAGGDFDVALVELS